MKKILKIFCALLLLAVVVNLAACRKKADVDLLDKIEQKGKIKAGVKYDSKPFGYMDADQKLKGFDVDLVKEIAKRLLGDENAVEFQQVTSSNRIFALNSGTVDLVAATMTVNKKRKKVIDFSNPYYIAGQAIMVPHNSDIRSIADLGGKKIIVVLGSTSEKNIKTLVPEAIIGGFRTYTDAFSAIRSRRGDALTTDDTIIAGFLSEDSNFKMLKERYTQEPYALGFKKSKSTKKFQAAINTIIEDMKADGTLENIRRKWMAQFE